MKINRKSIAPIPFRRRVQDSLHFAIKHEQRVWGSGSEHEKARAEVERLETILASFDNNFSQKP